MPDEPVDLAGLDPKVVVWDLDGTLWHGILDAGGSRHPRPSSRLLVWLAERGIVNSICSNNSPDIALSALRALGIDQYVVFPRIEWTDKSILMGEIVDFFGVGTDRVVLIDDDARVRSRLAEQFGIVAVDPADLEGANLCGWGIDGAGMARVEHYRVLARRRLIEIETRRGPDSSESGIDFLRSCRTRLHDVDVATSADRIAELSMRSNRLNLTRSRLTADDVVLLAEAPGHECRAVRVSDRFGDYGLCGFVAFDIESNRLDHFFWSCRVLNQGVVEHEVQQLDSRYGYRLDHPALVDFEVDVDWIAHQIAPPPIFPATSMLPPMLFVGGCDLDIIASLMDDRGSSATVWGLNEVDGVQQYGHSGVSLLAARSQLTTTDLAQTAIRLPWVGEVTNPEKWTAYDVVVLSLWVDYCCVTVRRRDDVHGVRAPSYKQIDDRFNEWDWNHWVGPALTRSDVARELVFEPPLTADELVAGLRIVRSAAPADTRLILLNAPEIDRPTTYEWGGRQDLRNHELNCVVAEFAAQTPNVTVLDITSIVTSPEDFVAADEPTGFHYRRDVYAEIARRLTAEVIGVVRLTQALDRRT